MKMAKLQQYKHGKTKVKITDTTNGLSTYIYLEIRNSQKADVQEGINFTIALKENGTVWSYGTNVYGQLGLGNNEEKVSPVKIENLQNIKQISVGYSHTLAVSETGEVYTWGAGAKGQLGNGDIINSNVPIKVEGLENIVKVSAYKNKSTALDKEGKIYIWGEGHQTLPMKNIFQGIVVDISGNSILTEEGRVYNITDLTNKISGLENISKISVGETHYLALDAHGVVYSWGTNSNGECGTATTGNITPRNITKGVYEVSAGNHTSILLYEDETIGVCGSNANGRIGLGGTANVTTITKVTLTEDVAVENISAGSYTHSGLVDINGFVWHTGTNASGELGIGNNTAKTSYTKTGDTVLKTGQDDTIYLSLNEQTNIHCTLENTFNLKIDIIDEEQSNFKIVIENNNILELNEGVITAKQYGKTKITVTHIQTGKKEEINVIVLMKMESIVQGFRDSNLDDGEYDIFVKDQIYTVELINIYDNTTYSQDVALGDSSTEYKTLVVKYHGDLTIDAGVTVTANTVGNLTYKKGMYLCVMGNLYNNGTITMTARGTYNAEGENVYLWKNIDSSYEYVPAIGGEGGEGAYLPNYIGRGQSQNAHGKTGGSGIKRALAGGGSGAAYGGWNSGKGIGSGKAGTATSYSGGAGSGGIQTQIQNQGLGAVSGIGSSKGANGGYATASRDGNWTCIVYGGTGNPNGGDVWGRNGGGFWNGSSVYNTNRPSGTGGLLTLYADTLYNNGTISSNGVNNVAYSYGNWTVGGGASGGGSVNIFARIIKEIGVQTANGGISTGATFAGGSGGTGSVTVNEIGSSLNYPEKIIYLKENETYKIEKEKLSYIKLNDIQTPDLNLGEITYEMLDKNIATINAEGELTAQKYGTTKVKVTDTTNKYSTYITIKVIKSETASQIKTGENFTIVLKENGTVWTYGDNGIIKTNEPEQVMQGTNEFKNIKQIGAGNKISIALSNSGEVYTWGIIGTQTEKEPRKEEKLSNIKKVDAYGNNFYAIDEEGNAYIWGKGYNEPTKIETDIKYVDITSKLLLRRKWASI